MMLLLSYILLFQFALAFLQVHRRYATCYQSYGNDHLYQLCNSTLYRDDEAVCDTVINPTALHYSSMTDKLYIAADQLLEYSTECELLETRDYGGINWVTSNQSAVLVGGYNDENDEYKAFVCVVDDDGECEYWDSAGLDSVYRMVLDGSNIYNVGVYNDEYAVFDKSTQLIIRFVPWHIVVTDKVYVVGFGTNTVVIATIDKGLTSRDPFTITGTLVGCEKLYCGYYTRSTFFLIRIDSREIFYERRFGNDLIYGYAESFAIDEASRKVAFGLYILGEIYLDGVVIQPGYFVFEVNVTFPIRQYIEILPSSTTSTRANLRRPSVNATSNSSVIPLIAALAVGSVVALAAVVFFIYKCTSSQQKVVQYQAPVLPLEQSFISDPTFTAQDTVQTSSSQRSFDLSKQDYEVVQVFRDGEDSKTELVRVLREELKQRASIAVLRTYKQEHININNEINILSYFKENRHFARLVAYSGNMICMRYYQDGDVSTKELSIENIISVARDIAFALVKLHERGYVHFELCSSRVLLEVDAKTGLYRAVLSGFGNVVSFQDGNRIANFDPRAFQRLRAESYAFLAPEIVSNLVAPQNTTTAFPVDVMISFDSFSWAMVVYEMINFEKPWSRTESKSEMFQKVLRDERPGFNDRGINLKLDERIKHLTDILFQAWDPRPQLRPNSKKILQMLA